MNIKTASVIANGSIYLMARFETIAGTYLQQSDVTAISLTTYDITDGCREIVGNVATPTADQAVSDSLLTDSRWTNQNDSVGYNVYCTVISPPVDRTYDYRLQITTSDGSALQAKWVFTGA